jgi:translation initiation factor IF-3
LPATFRLPVPPICKILNLGQFKYEREREARKKKSKAKSVEVKGIRLSPRIGQHDLETRFRTAESFLEDGDKVKVEIILRGREKAIAHLARGVIENFVKMLQEKYSLVVEQPIMVQGGQLTTIVGKK